MKKIKIEALMFSITVVIPFFNSEKTIRKTLESVSTQSNCDWRIVLVNDGSFDRSRTIAQEFQLSFNDKICIVDIENSGQSIARDIALSRVETDWVMYLDSDDLLEENVLGNISNALIQSNHNVIVMDYVVESNNQSTYISNDRFHTTNPTNIDIIKALDKKVQFSLWTSNLIYRTEYIKKNHFKFSLKEKLMRSLIDINHMGGEEIMFASKALYFSDKIKYIKLPLAKYVRRYSSMSYSYDYSRLGAFYNVLHIIDSFCNYSNDNRLKKILRSYYFKGALNGLIYNFYVLRKSYEKKNSSSISYSRLVKDSMKFYPMLLIDYRRISFKNLFTRNILKVSSIVNVFFSIFPIFTLNLTTIYFKIKVTEY